MVGVKIKKILLFIIQNTNIMNVFSILFYVFRIFKINNNRIFILNYHGKGYGDNAKYIVDELMKDNDYEIIWGMKKNAKSDGMPTCVKKVRVNSLKYFYYLVTSKVWINNSRFPMYYRKRKGQYYLQTWHSPLRLKKIEMDAVENLNKYYIKCLKNDSKMIDLMVCGCDFSYDLYRNAFLYDGEILKSGTPRCDVFFKNDYCKEIRKKVCDMYGIDFNNKIILYAPTFRNNKRMEEIIPDFRSISGNNTYLLRLHPNVKNEVKEKNGSIDVTTYPDMQELLCAADLLITDYSSCCFDMLIANKPCVLYTPDLDEYLQRERNLYFNFDELPFKITYTQEELKEYIQNIDYDKEIESYQAFYKKINLYEKGIASREVARKIKEWIENEKV